MAALKEGEWIYRRIDEQWKKEVSVFTGSWEKRKVVRKVTRMQAMALARWYGYPGIYYMVKDGNGRQMDIRVAGDIEAFHGDGEEE